MVVEQDQVIALTGRSVTEMDGIRPIQAQHCLKGDMLRKPNAEIHCVQIEVLLVHELVAIAMASPEPDEVREWLPDRELSP